MLAAAGPDAPPPADPGAAAAALTELVRAMVGFLLLRPEARLVAGFILREMAQPSSALDTIYDGLFEGIHRRACAIWAAATGQEPESETVRLAVFSAVGQIVYFHIGRPVVERRMGWPAIGVREADAVAETIVRNLIARIEADRRVPA